MNGVHRNGDDASHPAPHRHRAPGWQLSIALFLAPLAFTVQVVASYVLSARLCAAAADPRPWLVAIQVAAMLAAAAGFAVALALWRRTRNEKRGEFHEAVDTGEGRTRFLALCGLYASAIFLLAALVDASAVALVGGCPGIFAPG